MEASKAIGFLFRLCHVNINFHSWTILRIFSILYVVLIEGLREDKLNEVPPLKLLSFLFHCAGDRVRPGPSEIGASWKLFLVQILRQIRLSMTAYCNQIPRDKAHALLILTLF